MKDLEQLMKNYGRCLFLEGQLPGLEEARETARREALAAERNLSIKRAEWECQKTPGLFQRLLGRTEEKQDAAYRAYKEAETAWRLAERKAEDTGTAYEAAKAELERLGDVSDRYLTVKESREVPDLPELFRRHILPAALDDAQRCLTALESARDLDREPVAVSGNGREVRRQCYFNEAETAAKRLLWLLEQMPEGERWNVDYLSNPMGFLLLATQYGRMDRLNGAIAQVRQVKSWLQKE